MTPLAPASTAAPAAQPLPDGPHDLEFFLDPMCPFAWQTSVWLRRVAEMRNLRIGWRLMSLAVLNEHATDVPEEFARMHRRGVAVGRVLAAVRGQHGNDAVGALYEAWGKRMWYGDDGGSLAEIAEGIDLAALLSFERLPTDLAEAADDDSFDAVLRAETDLARTRAGDDVGTPVITFDPPDGRSFFGPIISAVPDDIDALRLYDSLATLVEFEHFAELKRTNRPPLDLPALAG